MFLSDRQIDNLAEDYQKQKTHGRFVDFVDYESWKINRAFSLADKKAHKKKKTKIKIACD